MTILRTGLIAALFLGLIPPLRANAQTIVMGMSLVNYENVPVSDVATIIDTSYDSNLDGRITTATFGWSSSPCPAAVKLKVFRPAVSSNGPQSYDFVDQRGPFDVTAPIASDGFATQTVILKPPLDVRAHDVIAITKLSTCGGPVYANWTSLNPPPGGGSLTFLADVTTTVSASNGSRQRWIFLLANGSTSYLGFRWDRFAVTLEATNPRTGVTAQGVPTLLGPMNGYFSLPDFTGEPEFPEVMVKMVDATQSPTLGRGFWFFHAPLTDVRYTLTVKDQYTGLVKTYSNPSAGAGQLCGGADTSAFPP